MKKILSLFVVFMLCVNMLSGCNSNSSKNNDNIRIYLTVSQGDTFRNSIIDAAKAEAGRIGAELVAEDAQGVLETQAAQIKKAAEEGYDAILCGLVNTDTALEFEDNSFDYIVMGFGLRNIPNKNAALAEVYRVLKPCGKFLHLDFGQKTIFSKIFNKAVLFAASIFTKEKDAYTYLINSKNNF